MGTFFLSQVMEVVGTKDQGQPSCLGQEAGGGMGKAKGGQITHSKSLSWLGQTPSFSFSPLAFIFRDGLWVSP